MQSREVRAFFVGIGGDAFGAFGRFGFCGYILSPFLNSNLSLFGQSPETYVATHNAMGNGEPKKKIKHLSFVEKTVPLQADYYQKRISD